MASPLREGVPPVEKFLAWGFTNFNALVSTCFLNTMMRDYGTTTPEKKYLKKHMAEYNFSQHQANILARAYRLIKKREYARIVQDMGRVALLRNLKDVKSKQPVYFMNNITMELKSKKDVTHTVM